jgi:hypothetical protein
MRHRHPHRRQPSRHPKRSIETIVREVGCPDELLPAYVAFARELTVAERSSCFVYRGSLRIPDYSRRTKQVVMKWFRRGLSGHLLWLIGEAVTGQARITKYE